MEILFIPALVGFTSLCAYLIGTRRLGLTRERLQAGVDRMVIYLGAALLFFGVNLGAGVSVVLADRMLGVGFLSVYLSNDVSLLVLSAIQGLVFACWRESQGAGSRERPGNHQRDAFSTSGT